MAKYNLYKLSSNAGVSGGASTSTNKTVTFNKEIGEAGIIKLLQDQGILSPKSTYSAKITDTLITILSKNGNPVWELTTGASESKATKLLSLIGEKKGIFWEPNAVGGIKGIYTSKADIDFRIDINPKPKGGGFSWMIGRAASDRFLNQGESKTEEDAKKDAVKFLKAMEARSLA